MRTKILILGLVCVFMLSCGYSNYSQRFVYYPEPPDILFDQVLIILSDLGYTIETESKTPQAGMRAIGYGDPFMIAKKGKHKALIIFKRVEGETEIEIHISQHGEKVSTEFLEKQRDEIAQKFEEQIK